MSGPYFWADDAESESWDGPHATEEDAIKDARQSVNAGAEIWIDTGIESDPAENINIEYLLNESYDETTAPVDECWTEYLGLDKAAIKECEEHLKEAFRGWLKARNAPRYWAMSGESRRVTI